MTTEPSKIKPYYIDNLVTEYHGHTPDVLREMPSESVHCIVTSIPYWGLRDYGLEPQIWDGDVDCEHEWGDESIIQKRGNPGGDDYVSTHKKDLDAMFKSQGQFCQFCGAWRGSLGLEPTIDLYISHLVQISREIKRVLRSDGTLWLNIGDSYASGKGDCFNPGGGENSLGIPRKESGAHPLSRGNISDLKKSGLKPKDLCMIPTRVALALQADGWWLRSDIIWCLSGGTKVYAKTQKGEFPTNLKDLYRLKPETVKLWNGEKWTQLEGMSKHERKGDEIELVLRTGERISCTPEHKWPTDNGLKKAKDLKKGDILDRCFLPQPDNQKYPYRIPDEIGWFVGTYLAEGSRDSSRTIQIASHIEEIDRFNRLSGIAETYAGTCRKHQTSEKGMVICLDSKVLNAIIDTYIAGKTAKDKHLSNDCWKRDNFFLMELLRGYLQGDGHWDIDNKRWRIGFTRNYYLESDIRTLCSRLSANLTLKLSEASIGDKKYKTFRGEIRLENTIAGHWNQKNKGEVIEIRKARARYFYSVGVEDAPHVFALASGVLTHNSKPNPMPESVTDRPTNSYEHIFLLTKSAKYFYDADAVKEESIDNESHKGRKFRGPKAISKTNARPFNNPNSIDKGYEADGKTYPKRNLRNVWTIATEPTPEAHFATFPSKLVEICIKAGTSEKGCCPECGAPWTRVIERQSFGKADSSTKFDNTMQAGPLSGSRQAYRKEGLEGPPAPKTIGWKPSCGCHPSSKYHTVDKSLLDIYYSLNPIPCTVLDPFSGSGKALIVAKKLGRKAIGIDLKQEYLKMPLDKLAQERLF